MDIEKEFGHRNLGRCCVGSPRNDGLRLGFEGWGEPDVLLDPAMPMDSQVEALGLAGKFKVVESHDLLHRLHGDCVLTHGVRAIASLAKPGGKVKFEFMCLHEVAREASRRMEMGDFVSAQAIEKHCFGQAADDSGLLYPQTMLSLEKMSVILRQAGCKEPRITKDVDAGDLPLFPDYVRLKGVEDKVWESSSKNFKMRDSLHVDRPSCVLCDRVATRRDHDRQFFSRYCKDHYHEAREACDSIMREAFTIRIKTRRRA